MDITHSICTCGFLSGVVTQMNQRHLDVKHLCACILYLVLNSRNKEVREVLADVDLKLVCGVVGRSILHITTPADDASTADQPAAARCLLSLLGYASLLVACSCPEIHGYQPVLDGLTHNSQTNSSPNFLQPAYLLFAGVQNCF